MATAHFVSLFVVVVRSLLLLFAHAEFITSGNNFSLFSFLYCILLTTF